MGVGRESSVGGTNASLHLMCDCSSRNFFCMSVLPVCKYVYYVCTWSSGGQKTSDSSELDNQMIMSWELNPGPRPEQPLLLLLTLLSSACLSDFINIKKNHGLTISLSPDQNNR